MLRRIDFFWGCYKNPPVIAEDVRDEGSIPELRRSPGGEQWQPTPVSLPGQSHGQRSLAGYSPQGRRVTHDQSDLAHRYNQ